MAAPDTFFDADELRSLQSRLNFLERGAVAEKLAEAINRHLEESGICTFQKDALQTTARKIHQEGYASLGTVLAPLQIVEIIEHFKNRSCFNAHLVAKSDGQEYAIDEISNDFPFGAYQQKDVIEAPYLLELANSPELVKIASDYLGCTPTLYSMNAWWSFSSLGQSNFTGQSFHRDEDDFKNCVLFIYLTDTDMNTGCHEYIRTTHRMDLVKRHLEETDFPLVNLKANEATGETARQVQVAFDALFSGAGYDGDAVYHALFEELIDQIEGPAGSGFMSDPSGLHRARPPQNGRRLIAWIRYGLYKNQAYVNDQLSPLKDDKVASRIPGTAKSRYINRLILNQ